MKTVWQNFLLYLSNRNTSYIIFKLQEHFDKTTIKLLYTMRWSEKECWSSQDIYRIINNFDSTRKGKMLLVFPKDVPTRLTVR